ncbi:regulatory protein SUAPRGA1 [Phlyctema vagabunda]|uniref:Regulatory protein SUAPRGA1 n=1 Tax=Phlyctema vagabunda TaxID=108571 RepID=A0ABR4PSM4_9HELO
MLSIRSFARSAPRAVSRLTSSAVRRPAARSSSLLQSSWASARTQHAAAFSTSNRRSKAEGDEELIAKIESEIQMENEMKDADPTPASITEYLENSPFKITDTPGQEEVILTRQFGDEKIRVSFSIADLNMDPENDYQDSALADEDIDSENINEGNPKSFKQAPEDSLDAEGQDGEQESAFPARVNIIIEKAGKGALAVETVAQEGSIIIDNVYYYTDATHAYAKSAEKAHERQDKYVGPPFGNLDEDLQVLLERYLDERGINTALAIFVPDYIDMKEQKEYLNWLSNVKGFVAA